MKSKNDNSKEFHFLVACCKKAIVKEASTPPVSEIESIDWPKLFQLASYHKISLLLHDVISTMDSNHQLPKGLLENLKKQRHRQTLLILNKTKELIRLLKLFKEADIAVLPYKGITLSLAAYNNLSLRTFSDFDLLIKGEDLKKAHQLLIKENYIRIAELPLHIEKNYVKYDCERSYIFNVNGEHFFHVDLHWYLGTSYFQMQIGYEAIEPFMVKSPFLNDSINTLNPTGNLLITTLHHAGTEQMDRLKYVCDIMALIVRHESVINWQALISLSEKLEVKNLLLYGLGVAMKIFDFPLPVEVQKHVSKKLDAIIAGTILTEHNEGGGNARSHLGKIYFHLRVRQKLSTKLILVYYNIIHILLPNRNDTNKSNLSMLEYYSLFLLKPIRLVKQCFFR